MKQQTALQLNKVSITQHDTDSGVSLVKCVCMLFGPIVLPLRVSGEWCVCVCVCVCKGVCVCVCVCKGVCVCVCVVYIVSVCLSIEYAEPQWQKNRIC